MAEHAGLAAPFSFEVESMSKRILVVGGGAADDQIGGALQREGVDGDIFRGKGDGGGKALFKAFHRVAGQTGDEVHVDIVVACLAGLGVAVQDILGRVLAADAG